MKMVNRSIEILQECVEVQIRKGADYQNPASTVQQADYYNNGVMTIYDTMHGKMLRIKSIQETMLNDPSFVPNHESLRDSCIDIINYASFYAAYLDGKVPGQKPDRDIFNRSKVVNIPIITSPIENLTEQEAVKILDNIRAGTSQNASS